MPSQWKSVALGTADPSETFASGRARRQRERDLQGHLGTRAVQRRPGRQRLVDEPGKRRPTNRHDTEKVRNTNPIKINEFRTGTSTNSTNSFIELYNSGDSTVDLSNWSLTERPTQQAVFSTITIPAGTKLAAQTTTCSASPLGASRPGQRGRHHPRPQQHDRPAPGQQIQIGSGASGARPARSPRSPPPARPAHGSPASSATPSSCPATVSTSSLPAGIVSGLHDFTISAWVNPSANTHLVADLRLRHRHQRLHVPHAQRGRRPASASPSPPAGTAPSSSSTAPASSR